MAEGEDLALAVGGSGDIGTWYRSGDFMGENGWKRGGFIENDGGCFPLGLTVISAD